ncbi:MAG: hypothetical protein ABS96_00055 [Lysobacteraceae bacterium SCN 69-123]|uniref:YkvA family protein n=1 Tax=Stenotrophomonas acidaminiphila TaxID=128780 RepID=UPI00086C05CE|nr:DUF1232 domain-containing protein [Stenotrophomonas acidaminiphila]MBN8803089.1 DUF1232 domain-containing protein [Stenotrophomonas acidaminiphila]MDF9442969.1 DUF1232 domain-containing protein [Stenotrophomonas acidaminiphila]ODU48488.1 MAG: hypothetical protein ABS96_00055 [Xanthomonadaceae bacterium SCN 69-123]OJY73033.1 MAG: hypothetical protein BGP18_02020 [Stenotrophomonas sp. 69-14]
MSSDNYQSAYSDASFWGKAKSHAKSAGKSAMEPALKMYYAAQDPETPAWAKAVIYSALGYFILPLDVIPDITPVAGYSDDVAVLAAALAATAANIKDVHVTKAKETLARWFS